MGLGLLGRGLGDAIFLAEHGAELTVTDIRDEQVLAPSLEKLKKYINIQYVLGEHRLEDFKGRDFILKAAGIPLQSPYIAEAKKVGVPVYMSTALFAKFAKEAGATIVGVTGTRGKSTVTHMIYRTLASAGRRAHLGGNVRGVSTLALLPDIQEGDVCVLELDSWQLQGFGELSVSPDVAVFTNLQSDHLNYYPNEETYFADKANIFKFQKQGDTLVVGSSVNKRWIASAHSPVAPVVPPTLPAVWILKLIGDHNRENTSFVVEALRALGLSGEAIKKGVESFEPVEGRLQYIRTVDGVEIYNDNNATTPDATIVALHALSAQQRYALNTERRIVLIMGGVDKGLDMKKLIEEIPKHCKAVIFLMETGTEKMLITYNVKRITPDKDSGNTLHATRYTLHTTPMYEAETLEGCVSKAMQLAEHGDVVLFSPAFASFGKWFKNEYERGEQFVKLVERL